MKTVFTVISILTLTSCYHPMVLSGNDDHVTLGYGDIILMTREDVPPYAEKHCAKYGKKAKYEKDGEVAIYGDALYFSCVDK